MKVNAQQLAAHYGVDRRTVTNWVNSRPPCPSEKEGRERVFDTRAVARWHAETAARAALAAREKDAPGNFDAAKLKRETMMARLAELDVAEREGALVSADTVTAVVGEVCDRLRAVCINLAANFGLDLERAGVDAKAAEVVLDRISEALVRALRGAADEVDDGDDGDGDAA